MAHFQYLSFKEGNFLTSQEKLFTNVMNNFTIEFWAKPERHHTIDKETKKGITETNNKRFVVVPIYGAQGDGDSSQAGIGISVGVNGVSIYEHTINHLPATLVAKTLLNDWSHIAVVYKNKIPSLYINGKFIKEGMKSTKQRVFPSAGLGGTQPFGSYVGLLRDVRIWSIAKTKSEIQQDMHRQLTGNEQGLFAYWRLSEGTGGIAHDSTRNKRNYSINGAVWNGQMKVERQNNKINILFAYYIPSGGIETLNRQRFYALSKEGINCDFLYGQEGTGLQNKMSGQTFITKDEDEIKKIIYKGKYNAIVVCSDYRLIKKIRKVGYKGLVIYENQGLGKSIDYADQYFKEDPSSPIINQYCDAILYPMTPHLMRAFDKYFPSKKKFCFHNCFNTEEFGYEVHPKIDRPLIGWVGRLESNKNWRDFLTIAARLIQENPLIYLWMFEDNTLSSNSERQAFQQRVEELKLSSHLTIFANQPHSMMAGYFSKIGDSGGFLCSTSKVEGFGYAVLEALVCRCPVLSTDSEGVRSFIKHNETGKFYEHENINQAVQEGRELMVNTQLRESIRQKGVQHIKVNFSPEKYAANFKSMIMDLQNHT